MTDHYGLRHAGDQGRGTDPRLLTDELRFYIDNAILNHPRSLQKAIGPSELNHACQRRMVYKLLDHDEVNEYPDTPWLPTVGTAVHSWLAEVFGGPATRGRFLVEQRVTVGYVNGQPVTGSADLYDTVTATVVDWKAVGATTLRTARSKGPSGQYLGQINLYGRGFVAMGHPVDRVMIVYLPRNDELKSAYFWHAPYSEFIADAVLAQADRLAKAAAAVGPAILRGTPTADAHCNRCPFFSPRSTDPASQGCPGDPARRQQPDRAASQLIAS